MRKNLIPAAAAVVMWFCVSANAGEDGFVRYTIVNFVTDARMISADVAVQKRAVSRVYALLNRNDAAYDKMGEYMIDEKTPFEKASHSLVDVEVISVTAGPGSSWDVEWLETVCDRAGGDFSESYRMRANMSCYFAPVDRAGGIHNPMSFFVRDFSWNRIE